LFLATASGTYAGANSAGPARVLIICSAPPRTGKGYWTLTSGYCAPTGNVLDLERLIFSGAPGTFNNDLPGTFFPGLFFVDGDSAYLGNTATIQQIFLSVRDANFTSLWGGADILARHLYRLHRS